MAWVYVGLAAATLTTVSLFPQVVKSYRSRQTRDLSWLYYGIFTAGITLWLVYGVAQRDAPLIVGNALSLVLAIAILLLKAKHG